LQKEPKISLQETPGINMSTNLLMLQRKNEKLSRDILNKNIKFCRANMILTWHGHPRLWAPAELNYQLYKYYQLIYLRLTETQTSGPPLQASS